MKLKILIVIETVALIFFILYGYIKSAEADMQKTRAEELAVNTMKLREAAENEAMRAEKMAAKSIEIQTYAESIQSELEECRTGK